ncbi:DUF4242 domain-containing protein [Jannaschia sp. W003]|uniref:DUF4242 domain-containing protein n=1 Tax=Jannaschia sp. W003 TaxID=2867012 RepID=UPI0021A8CD7D|nr:DUF4242 domain-containing protein [Jannaschia sp. W003]UWQ20778.1 DUF4242 domain-containing protein [Jannaschia sp. W003]
MTTYMVERNLGGISREDLGGAQRAAIATASAMREQGENVRYLRSTFAPDDGRCFCLFEADTDEQVRRLNDDAGLPYDRVTPALDLAP